MTQALAQLPNTQLSKTIGSLALLKTTWEVRQTDYIDNFVPFLATLIKKQKYLSINVNKVCDDFKNEFGLIIPYHPMIGLINRAQKKGLIKRGADSYEPVWEKIESIQFEPEVHDQLRKIEYIIDEMISFNHRVFAAQTSREEAESNILSFLKEYDVDIIYDIENNVFPNVTIASKNRFFTYRFIQNAYKSNPKIFEYIMDLAIGSVLANSILNNDIVNMSGKLSGINLYFDTRFILRLLGTEGEERSESYQEFLKLLSEEDAKLYIFNHTYDEIIGILKDSKRRIRNTKTDYSQASPVLLYFIQEEFNESDIDRFITKVELVISANNISIQNAPEPEELKLFQIDYDKLFKTIVGRYKRRNPSYNEKEKEDALLKDVKSIEAIYKFRKGKNPKAINDSVSIFITTNTALAQAVKSFGLSENVHYRIPACITDVLLGTILWLQSPTQVTKINEKKIIADCIAALQPNEQLLRRFLLEVDKLQQEKMIDEREYLLLRSYRGALDALEEKTFGDINNFTDQTAEEILQEIKDEIHGQAVEMFEMEKEQLVTKLDDYERNIHELEKKNDISEQEIRSTHSNLDKISNNIATLLSSLIYVLLIFVISIGTWAQFNSSFLEQSIYLRIGSILLTLILGALSVYSGFNIKNTRSKTKEYIRNNVYNFLTGKR